METEKYGARTDSDILTTRGAAQLLGVAVSTVQQWVDSGVLASWTTPGGHRRIPLAAVQAQLRSQAQRGARAPTPERDQERAPERAPAAVDGLPAGSYPVALDEAARTRAALATGLFDTAASPAYDRMVRLASQVAGTPTALVSLLDYERQWFKARVGMAMTQTPRCQAFCNYAVLSDEGLYVEDASRDERFRNNPLVTGEAGVRFYAGNPLYDRDGYRIGTLCVLDRVPRTLSEEQRWALKELAAMMSEEIQRAA